MYKINQANIKDWAKNYKGPLFDGILCDPPYELGFMGKAWDNSGIAFDKEMWADILKLLKPGGHLLAFSGSRTYHRMAVAIEDAGFEIRDQLIWMYGSGFPKSLNIGKAVDKIQGNEREDLGHNPNGRPNTVDKQFNTYSVRTDSFLTRGTSEWEGYGTALKPAHEPCVLARKPLGKGMTVAGNVLTHGTGGLNIDGTRISIDSNDVNHRNPLNSKSYGTTFGSNTKIESNQIERLVTGRFPANLIHDGSDEVEAVFPQTGKSSGGAGVASQRTAPNGIYGNYTEGHISTNLGGLGDSGSASRYFYTAKSSRRERNAGLDTPNTHPTLKPLSLTKYLATLIKPPTGGRLLVPFSGSGSEMIGALQAGWEYVEGVELTEEYIPIAEARIKHWLEQKQIEENQPKQAVLI